MTGPVHLPPHTSHVKSLAEMIRAILAAPKTGNWLGLDEILAGTGEKERSAVLRTLGGFTAVYERKGQPRVCSICGRLWRGVRKWAKYSRGPPPTTHALHGLPGTQALITQCTPGNSYAQMRQHGKQRLKHSLRVFCIVGARGFSE